MWIHVKDVVNPNKGFTWKVYFCGLDDDPENPGQVLEMRRLAVAR